MHKKHFFSLLTFYFYIPQNFYFSVHVARKKPNINTEGEYIVVMVLIWVEIVYMKYLQPKND